MYKRHTHMIWSNWWFQPLRWEIRYLAITRDAHARKRVMISIFAHHTFILAVTTLWLWLHTHYIVLDTSYNWPVTTVLHKSHKKHQHPVLSRRSARLPKNTKSTMLNMPKSWSRHETNIVDWYSSGRTFPIVSIQFWLHVPIVIPQSHSRR